MNIEEEFRQLDFTDNEIKVYLTLLRVGRSKAGKLAKEASIERTSTYNSLKKLIEKGLVASVIESNESVFSPAEPSKIIDMFKEKQERASLIVPKLKELKKFEREKESILKFRGYSGVKTVLNDVLNSCKTGDEYLIMGTEGQLSERIPVFAKIFVSRKDTKKLRARILMKESSEGKPQSKFTKVRFVPQEVVSPANVTIYSDKVAVVLWSETPEAIIIDNSDVAKTFKSYFEFMWKSAKQNTLKTYK